MAMIPEIIERLIAAWEVIGIFQKFAKNYTVRYIEKVFLTVQKKIKTLHTF